MLFFFLFSITLHSYTCFFAGRAGLHMLCFCRYTAIFKRSTWSCSVVWWMFRRLLMCFGIFLERSLRSTLVLRFWFFAAFIHPWEDGFGRTKRGRVVQDEVEKVKREHDTAARKSSVNMNAKAPKLIFENRPFLTKTRESEALFLFFNR
jgi:hypothetical protein